MNTVQTKWINMIRNSMSKSKANKVNKSKKKVTIKRLDKIEDQSKDMKTHSRKNLNDKEMFQIQTLGFMIVRRSPNNLAGDRTLLMITKVSLKK